MQEEKEGRAIRELGENKRRREREIKKLGRKDGKRH